MANTDKKISISISNGSIIRVILFLILLVSLYVLRDLILVLLTSIVLATFIERAANRIIRDKIFGVKVHRTLAVVFLFLVSLLFLAGIFYLFVPLLINEVSNASVLVNKYLPSNSLSNTTTTINSAKDFVQNLSHNLSFSDIVDNTRNIVNSVSSGFFGTLTAVFGGIVNVVLILVISFYLSIQEKGIEKFLRVITPDKQEEYIIDLWNRAQRKIALWIKGQLLLGVLIGVLIYLGLTIIGLQYALLIAILAAMFELIPFGLILAVIPAISFAYLKGGISLALVVGGYYLIVQQFETYLIQPLVIKRVIGISPLVVILSILIGAKLAGFWGLILAVPVAVCIMEFFDDIEKKKNLNVPDLK